MRAKKQNVKKDNLALITAALDVTAEGILIINRAGKIVYYNQKLLTMWQMGTADFNNHSASEIIFQMAKQVVDAEHFVHMLSSFAEPDFSCTEELLLADGKIFNLVIKPHHVKGKTIGRIITFHDETEQKKQGDRLLQEATHDPLTGLANRKLLLEYLQQAEGYANRTNLLFAVLFLDLDQYKRINDTYGHVMGDVLLQDVAARLQACVRENDVIIRLGGDEFVLLITTLQRKKDIIPVADKILAAIAQPFSCLGQEINVTASIGISWYVPCTNNLEIFIEQADAAMYLAKKAGGNNFQFYENTMG